MLIRESPWPSSWLMFLLFIPHVGAMTAHDTHAGGVPIPVVPNVNYVYVYLAT